MKQFVGTFGLGTDLANRYQPINAPGLVEAQEEMQMAHGTGYAFIYTQAEFNQSKSEGYFKNLRPLQTLISREAV